MPLPQAPSKLAEILESSTLPKLKARPPLNPKSPSQTANRSNRSSSPTIQYKTNTPIEVNALKPNPETPPPSPSHKTPSSAPVAKKAVTKKISKRQKKELAVNKIFVVDTNVLLHDPTSIFRFQEHDVFIPMIVLEELDHNKKGLSEIARNARQVSRYLDALVAHTEHELEKGIELNQLGHADATGCLYFETEKVPSETTKDLFPESKNDNQILDTVYNLAQRITDKPVVLVSKDINMRLKARVMGLETEDYLNDHTMHDTDMVFDGFSRLPENFWNQVDESLQSWVEAGVTYYKFTSDLNHEFVVNQFLSLEGDMPLQAQVRQISGNSTVISTVRDYGNKKNNVWGINARNIEQNFALNMLMDPECDFVTILGQAGTGKTLLALAAGLTQVLETKRYSEIIMTRATVSVGEDIGYLPGTEEEKMLPWMGALQDNLEFLHTGNRGMTGDIWEHSAGKELIESVIRVKSMSFMRGRTFLNKFVIVDEAQNLTAKQMKTLITRAGPGTKIVCLGNIAQIDTPYLTESSSGLTYVVNRFKGWSHSGHITLQKGERSRLADYAADAL
ncbi:PhoH family protein [Brackiella oedipodis]|uniref:PhoH family protein n=1 Tax=Brackiella oedipodis TaxID=124225 RepID=UPI00048ED6C8|nr:PhoH family protein [Brackiella oedipodis]